MFYTNHTTEDRVRKGNNDILAFVSREGRWGLSACCAWTTSGGLSYWHCPGDEGREGLVHPINIFQKITVCLSLYRTLQHVFPKAFESYIESITFILLTIEGGRPPNFFRNSIKFSCSILVRLSLFVLLLYREDQVEETIHQVA